MTHTFLWLLNVVEPAHQDLRERHGPQDELHTPLHPLRTSLELLLVAQIPLASAHRVDLEAGGLVHRVFASGDPLGEPLQQQRRGPELSEAEHLGQGAARAKHRALLHGAPPVRQRHVTPAIEGEGPLHRRGR